MREFNFDISRWDETDNKNNNPKDDIIYKLIDRHIRDSNRMDWKIIATDTSRELKVYYDNNIKGSINENSVRCFQTKKKLVFDNLSTFEGIEIEDLSKTNTVFYFFILFQKL